MCARVLGPVIAAMAFASAVHAAEAALARLDTAGLTLASMCGRVDVDALAGRLLVELGARPLRPRASLSLTCDDAGPRFVLARASDDPPLERAFRWPGGPSDEPERWLALAIGQSLVDAGVLAPRDPDAVTNVALPPKPAPLESGPRSHVSVAAGWRWLSLGRGWNGPELAIEAGRTRGVWAFSLIGSGCVGVERRELGSVTTALIELDAAVAERAWTGARSALWIYGALGVAGVQLSGQASEAAVVVGRARGLAPVMTIGTRFVRQFGPVNAGFALRAGVIASAPAGYVRGEDAVRTSGLFAGASITLAGTP